MRRTFIDSGVLMCAAQGREGIAEKALDFLDDPERKFISSDFVKLELLPKTVYFNQKNENKFYNEYFGSEQTEIIKLNQALIDEALTIASSAGLSAMDAIHVAIAKKANAGEFVTTEKSSSPFSRIKDLDMVIITISK